MTYSAPDGSRLVQDIEKAGFYPQLVTDVVMDSLDGRQPASTSCSWRPTSPTRSYTATSRRWSWRRTSCASRDDQQLDENSAGAPWRACPQETVPISRSAP
ncbi:DUF5998 family protein [Kocuria rhizophila]|nr:DUF5998 family protein [Kocuria rhizophila]